MESGSFQKPLYLIGQLFHVGRHRRQKADRQPAFRMKQSKFSGMKRLVGKHQPFHVRRVYPVFDEPDKDPFIQAVELVSDHRISQGQQCGPNLVVSAGAGNGLNQADSIAGFFSEYPGAACPGFRRRLEGGKVPLFFSNYAGAILTDPSPGSDRFCREPAMDQRQVTLENTVFFKLMPAGARGL